MGKIEEGESELERVEIDRGENKIGKCRETWSQGISFDELCTKGTKRV